MFLNVRNIFILPSVFFFRTYRVYSFSIERGFKLKKTQQFIMLSHFSSEMDVTAASAALSRQQNILVRVIRELPSEMVTTSTILDTDKLFNEFLSSKRTQYETSNRPTTDRPDDMATTLARSAVAAGSEFVKVATVPGNGKMQKHIRMNLETAAAQFTSTASTTVAGILSLSLAMTSLSILNSQQNGSNRAAASAIMSVAVKNKYNTFPESDKIVGAIVLTLLKMISEGQHQQDRRLSDCELDLNIIATLARSFGVHAHRNDDLSITTGTVINYQLSLHVKDDEDGESLNNDADNSASQKASLMGVLALAAQLDPWTNLSPSRLIQEAVPFDLWHGAERVCESVIRWQRKQLITTTTLDTTREAVHAIIDLAMEAKRYRHADNFATEFYNHGGDSRYLEARFYHACDTIAKVIQKKAFPVIEKQVERVDAAVAKSDKVSNEDFSNDVRMFALAQLAEVGEIEAGKRLHELWNISHEYDEKTIAAAMQARKAKYIQWEEIVPGCPVPELISTADQLMTSFVRLGFGEAGLYGFDAEWGDDSSGGVALLQIATTKHVMLIDVPALSMTLDGTEALTKTVGKLFACPTAIIAGFACRQDVVRLRSSPCFFKEHWLGRTEGIVDVQIMAGKAVPTLRRTGLSKACEFFIGKPLDKSEQCSLWSARPLTREQKVYAVCYSTSRIAKGNTELFFLTLRFFFFFFFFCEALDALVCTILYERIVASPDDI